jgi:hypothetical protein
MTSLQGALAQFETVEANLTKLDHLWNRIRQMLPGGPSFGGPPEYDDACFAFRQILEVMPSIDGFRVTDELLEYDAAGQMHLDASEIGEIEAQVSVSRIMEAQGRALAEYRRRFERKRRELVRDRLISLIDAVDAGLRALQDYPSDRAVNEHVNHPAWLEVKTAIDEIDTLLGSAPRPGRWTDLRRHLHFGMVQDLLDVRQLDWETVRDGLRSQMYGAEEPLPLTLNDLADVVAAKPSGPVTHALQWDRLNDEDFERLIFNLISHTEGYENPQWLQKTRAPDRGRDLSVARVVKDALGGVRRFRVIVQCKHWLSKSVGPGEVGLLRAQMETWEPPRVDELIIATTGRFTDDAIGLIERHNQEDHRLTIAMWPDSHLESLLAARPHLIAEFGLRR